MSAQDLHITSYVRIGQQGIACNGLAWHSFEPGAPLPDALAAAYRALEPAYPKFFKMDLLSKLGWLGVEALKANGWQPGAYEPASVAMVVANSHASNDADLNYWESTRQVPSPALFVYTLPNIVLGEISIRNGWKGEQAFLIQDAFDATQLLEYVEAVMATGETEVCIAGWLDVWKGTADGFLVVIEKTKTGTALPLSAAQLMNLYKEEIWK